MVKARSRSAMTRGRVEELLRPDVPRHDVAAGYVDTLPDETVPPPGRAQATWQTVPGSLLWQRIQPLLASLLVPGYRTVDRQLRLRPGATVLDSGCGPGNLTTRLAAAVAPDGVAVGLDISEPMLQRAAAQARPNMGLVRGDATHLPFRDNGFDAACATAVIMLVPDPARALAEMVRVVAPGGLLTVMVPGRAEGRAARLTGPLTELLGRLAGARMFATHEVPDMLADLGCDHVHALRQTNMVLVRARSPR